MKLPEETRKYFYGLHETRSFDEMLDLIDSWLDINFEEYDIPVNDYIYNKGEYANKFYDAIKYNGTNKEIT